MIAKDLKVLLDRVLVSMDAIRPAIVEPTDDGARLVSTDGHRMTIVETSLFPATAKDMLLDKRPLELLRLAISGESALPIPLSWSDGSLVAEIPGAQLRIRDNAAATFPPWRQVLPTPKASIEIERLKLAKAIARLPEPGEDPIVPEGQPQKATSSAVVLSADMDGLRVSRGGFGELVKGDWSSEASSEQIGFSRAYLADMLAGAKGKMVKIGWTDSMSPLLASDEADGWRHILMPMRI